MQSDARNDRELWLLISQQNDQPAFEQLYRRHMRVLMAAILQWSDDRQEAEDILQEIFLHLWERRTTIDIKGDVFPYLYSMARYKIFDRLRKKQLTEKQVRAWIQITGEAVIQDTVFQEEELQYRESLLATELTRLPAQMKKVYLLSTQQGKSIREISEELLVSPYTVKNHLQQIRKRLRSTALKLSSFFVSLLLLVIPH